MPVPDRARHLPFACRAGSAGALVALLVAGCATPAPEPPPAPVVPPAIVVAPLPACPSCDEQVREIARLQQEIATRDAELRELRSTQRDQAKSAQETTREVTREVTRAKAKARRLATQADAASYLAEVEVAIAALRRVPGTPAALPALATSYLAAAAEPFARGDYGMAMERASQAEQIVALGSGSASSLQKSARAPGEKVLQVALPLRAVGEASVRRQPQGKAPPVGVVAKDTSLTAFAWKDGWMRVETEDGVAGWVEQGRVAVR